MDSISDVKTTKKRSIILQYFPMELYIEITKVTMMTDADNNEKGSIIKDLLANFNVPYTSLGSGTNRMAVLIEGYAVKIALDKDGMIDNRREMLYSKNLQPYVVKVYECVPTGLIAVTEYVSIFTLDDFHTYQNTMRNILGKISTQFLIGDVGVTGKNYVNWGVRDDGTICILDFAYIYAVQYKLFVCSCSDDALLKYDNDYVNMRCPRCGRKYTFGEIRKKVTKAKQEMEIGDIRRLGYNLTQSEQIVPINKDFEPRIEKKKKKTLTPTEEAIRNYRKGKSNNNDQDWDYPDQ